VNNFGWGLLHLGASDSLQVVDGDDEPGGALYVRRLALEGGLAQLASIVTEGMNLYYDPTEPTNDYLAGAAYSLAGGGQLLPILLPEPGTGGMILVGLLAATTTRRKGPARVPPPRFAEEPK
jgi:hypothetical protein